MSTDSGQSTRSPVWTPNLRVRTQKAGQRRARKWGFSSCGFGTRPWGKTLTGHQCACLCYFSDRLIISLKKNLLHFRYRASHLPHCGWRPRPRAFLIEWLWRANLTRLLQKPSRCGEPTCSHTFVLLHFHPNCCKHSPFIIKCSWTSS